MKSRESCSIVGTAQPASSATWPASLFNGIDFSCGLHESLSSGILSNVVLAVAISRSNSERNRSLSFIVSLLLALLPDSLFADFYDADRFNNAIRRRNRQTAVGHQLSNQN